MVVGKRKHNEEIFLTESQLDLVENSQKTVPDEEQSVFRLVLDERKRRKVKLIHQSSSTSGQQSAASSSQITLSPSQESAGFSENEAAQVLFSQVTLSPSQESQESSQFQSAQVVSSRARHSLSQEQKELQVLKSTSSSSSSSSSSFSFSSSSSSSSSRCSSPASKSLQLSQLLPPHDEQEQEQVNLLVLALERVRRLRPFKRLFLNLIEQLLHVDVGNAVNEQAVLHRVEGLTKINREHESKFGKPIYNTKTPKGRCVECRARQNRAKRHACGYCTVCTISLDSSNGPLGTKDVYTLCPDCQAAHVRDGPIEKK